MISLEARHGSMEGNIISRSEFLKVRRAAIKKFANMGLSGREISFALEIETGIKDKPRNVIDMVHRARQSGALRQLTPEEKADIAKTTANSWDYTDEVIKKDVLSILQNIKRLQEEGKPLPQDRLGLAKYRLPHSKSQWEHSGLQVGNKIVFPGGRHIPTFKGRSQSEKQRQSGRERNKMSKSPEQVAKQSTVWLKVKPLRRRLGLSSEIAELTGFTKKQVKRAIGRNRPRWNKIPALTPEQFAEFKKRVNKAKKRKNQKSRELPTQDEKNNLAFARIVLESGLISEDLRYWYELNSIYSESKRDLPESFVKRLRLEVFLRAQLNANNGNKELMDKYVEWGLRIDKDWFGELAAEEEFITRIVREREDKLFLELFSSIRKEFAETKDIRVLDGAMPFLKQDPTIRTRLRQKMDEIIRATPSIKRKDPPPVAHGEMSIADIMGWGAR